MGKRAPTVDELDLAFALHKAREAGLVKDVKEVKEPPLNVIYLHETMAESVLKDAVSFGSAAALAAFGHWLCSPAAQWFGFIAVTGGIVSLSYRIITGTRRCKTIAEARAELDRIEKEGKL